MSRPRPRRRNDPTTTYVRLASITVSARQRRTGADFRHLPGRARPSSLQTTRGSLLPFRNGNQRRASDSSHGSASLRQRARAAARHCHAAVAQGNARQRPAARLAARRGAGHGRSRPGRSRGICPFQSPVRRAAAAGAVSARQPRRAGGDASRARPRAVRRRRAVDLGLWRIVLLDSTIAGSAAGRLSAQTPGGAGVGAAPAAPQRHALVCLHHHPVPMDSRWLDRVGLQNAAEFFDVIDRHPNVRGIVWGHVHQSLRRGCAKACGCWRHPRPARSSCRTPSSSRSTGGRPAIARSSSRLTAPS